MSEGGGPRLPDQCLLWKDRVKIHFKGGPDLWRYEHVPEARHGLEEAVVPAVFAVNAEDFPQGSLLGSSDIAPGRGKQNFVHGVFRVFLSKKIVIDPPD